MLFRSRVEHFLVAGREMNVYLGIASLAATEFGIVTCMYTAQNGYEKGFAGAIPGICQAVGTIYLSSMTVLLIACCYWRRANNWGAAAAIVCGAVVPICYLIIEQVPKTKPVAAKIGPYYSGIATYLLVGAAMVVGSWLKPRDERGARSEV